MSDGDTKIQAESAPKLPTSLKFIRQVNFPDEPECVCRYNGVTYVGLYNGVAKVSDDKTTGEMIIDDVADATGLFIYKDEIYVLVNDVSYFKMYVYNLQGKRKREWDTCMHCVNHGMIKFAVINDKIVIPHPQEDLLLIYSLTGESLKNIPCPLGSCDQVYIHTANDDCVIVSPCNPMGPLFKINIENGDILWRKSNLKSPNGAVSYKVDYLLVCARDSTDYHIFMLNIHTGK